MQPHDQDLVHLLRAQQWTAIAQRLEGRKLETSEEFQALAFLHIQRRKGQVPWSKVVFYLKSASALEPGNPEIVANLAQAFLDSGDAASSLLILENLERRYPSQPRLKERIVYCQYKSANWEAALQAFTGLRSDAMAWQSASSEIRDIGQQLESLWWRPITIGPARLRGCLPADLDFLTCFFSNSSLMNMYHRAPGAPETRARDFIKSSERSPFESCELHWIVEDTHGKAVGLVSLVDFSWSSKRAEILLGSIEKSNRVTILSLCAVLHFAFNNLNLKKIVAVVYGDNDLAQRQTIELGFQNEGYLRSHICYLGIRSDVFINGLTQQDFAESLPLARLVRRYLRADNIRTAT